MNTFWSTNTLGVRHASLKLRHAAGLLTASLLCIAGINLAVAQTIQPSFQRQASDPKSADTFSPTSPTTIEEKPAPGTLTLPMAMLVDSPSPLIAGGNGHFNLILDRVPSDVAEVRFMHRQIQPGSNPCRLILDSDANAQFLSATALGSGKFSVRIRGLVSPYRAGNAAELSQSTFAGGQSCDFTVPVRIRKANQADFTTQVMRGVFKISGSTTFTVENTKDLRGTFFEVFPLKSSQVCSGMSEALGQPNYPVGMRVEDGDLVFAIRSGPKGTVCKFGMRFSSSNMAVTATNVEFKVLAQDKECRIVDDPESAFAITRVESNFGTSVLPYRSYQNYSDLRPLSPIAFRAGNNFMPSMLSSINHEFLYTNNNIPSSMPRINLKVHQPAGSLTLVCDNTLVNDKGIKVKLERVRFRLPPGQGLGSHGLTPQ